MTHQRAVAPAGPVVDVQTELPPVRLAAHTEEQLAQPKTPVVPGVPGAQPGVPGTQSGVVPKAGGIQLDLVGPRGSVTFTPLPEFGAGIITANNQADLQLALQIVKQIEEYLKSPEAAKSAPKLKIVELQYGDAVEVTNLVNQLGARATGLAVTQGRPNQPGFAAPFGGFGQQAQQQQGTAGGSVLLIPFARRNAILMFGPEIRFPYYENLIKQFDTPNTNKLIPIQLKKASAQQVANLLTQFYQQRYVGENQQTDIVRFTYDTSTNQVFVQAGRADLEEIKSLIERLDNATPAATNDLRIIPLKNTPADELANTLQTALLANVLPQGTGVVQTTGTPGAPGAPGAQGGFPGAQTQAGFPGANLPGQAGTAGRAGTLGSQASNTTKTVSLRFMNVESGYLEDVHITADIRSNTLIISARPETQALLAKVIEQLDRPSAAQARVNVFTLKHADANLTANLLQQLFYGQSRTTGTNTGFPGGPNAFSSATTGSSGVLRPLLTVTGTPGESAALIQLAIGVDDRTNSIVVAGSQNDLDAVRAIIARLEDAPTVQRTTHVVKLRNAGAVDVANALSPFLTQTLTVINTNITATNFLDITRQIVVAAEPVSNNLLVNCTPEAFNALLPIIERLDAQPLQVAVEVLIAEVDLTNNEEFGAEIGLQSPILFSRTVIPTANGASFTNTTGATAVPPGVSISSSNVQNYAGQAFAFNTTTAPAYSNLIQQGIVGFQGITNYGVGRANANGVGGFVFSAGSDTVNVLIRALKTQGRIDNLTRPTVTVLDNQIGLVNIGGLYPYVTGATANAFGTITPTISNLTIGTSLTVSPRISPDGRILMRVEPSIIAPQATQVSLGNGLFATSFTQQTVQTTVSVMDGETIVLGGLLTKTDNRTENKVPWLGDLPYIGAAFRYRTQAQERREILVVLTPRVIRNCIDSERHLMDEARKMSWKLKDVESVCTGCQKAVAGPDAYVGPDGPPPGVLPPNAWVQPNGGSPLPLPNVLPEPTAPAPNPVTPIPPAQADPMPPKKPAVPEAPKIPVPMPPKPTSPTAVPVLPVGYEPAGGIVPPAPQN